MRRAKLYRPRMTAAVEHITEESHPVDMFFSRVNLGTNRPISRIEVHSHAHSSDLVHHLTDSFHVNAGVLHHPNPPNRAALRDLGEVLIEAGSRGLVDLWNLVK